MLPYARPPSQLQNRPERTSLRFFRKDPVGFLRQAAREQGDVARFRLAGRNVILLSTPTLVRSLLVTHAASFVKGPGLARAKSLLGNGMLTAELQRHTASRKRLTPAFTRTSVDSYVPDMTAAIDRELHGWVDGAKIDVGAAMTRITLAVAGRCLFGVDFTSETACDLSRAVADALEASYGRLHESSTPVAGRAQCLSAAKSTLASITDQALGGVAGCPIAHGPVPATLRDVAADEAREEALTILLAAQESLAIGLTWALVLLGRQPDLPRRSTPPLPMREGLEPTPARSSPPLPQREGDRLPRMVSEADRHVSEDLSPEANLGTHSVGKDTMPYARAVLAEAMRLYPPAWLLTREATRAVRLGDDLTVDVGTVVLAAPCVSHADARYWDSPEEFRPERWQSGPRPHSGLYFPFGIGPRNCIGEQFAWTEGALAIDAITQRFAIEIDEMEPEAWDPLVNLRPRGPVIGRVKARA